MDDGVIVRPTARLLLLDPDNRVFLLHAGGEYRGSGLPVWMPPGGGLEADESHEEAALRELSEEIGLSDVTLEACVWLRSLPFAMEDRLPRLKEERYYVCRVEAFEVQWDAVDMTDTLGGRWWRLDEIEASGEVFVPRALAALLRPIIAGHLPDQPYVVDV